jgi:hypothetical protein
MIGRKVVVVPQMYLTETVGSLILLLNPFPVILIILPRVDPWELARESLNQRVVVVTGIG